jgi:pantoate kinase
MQFAKAFCPGHITGFFEICDSDPDPSKRGSRGAGFSTSLGAVSSAAVEPRERQKITVVVHGLDDYAGGDVTIRAIKHLIGDARLKVEIETDLQLPLSQGFGMSGAGALSAALAAAGACEGELELSREDAVRAAHLAEVESRTGLGDVAGQSVGGFERRLEPGLPPFGKVAAEPLDAEVVLCVLGGALETKSVLSDPLQRERIISAGRKAVESFSSSANLMRFCEASWAFARDARLDTPEIARAMGDINSVGCGSMAMLGHSVFAFGDAEKLETILTKYGRTFRCRVAPEGAKVLLGC